MKVDKEQFDALLKRRRLGSTFSSCGISPPRKSLHLLLTKSLQPVLIADSPLDEAFIMEGGGKSAECRRGGGRNRSGPNPDRGLDLSLISTRL